MNKVTFSCFPKIPECVRGATQLNKDAFRTSVKLPYIAAHANDMAELLSVATSFLFKMENFYSVRDSTAQAIGSTEKDRAEVSLQTKGRSSKRLKLDKNDLTVAVREALLDPDLLKKKDTSAEGLLDKVAKIYGSQVDSAFMHSGTKEVDLCYDNWNWQQILAAVLPTDFAVSTYSKIGHIIHLNLREHLHPFKFLIGQVLLEKVSSCKTVVNKVDIIDSTFREFEMEVLAGDHEFNVEAKENGLRYKFDFSKVFWNPRLSTERRMITSKFKKGDVVFDACSGVGPFVLPALRQSCEVYANDLNSHCIECLENNIKLNKLPIDNAHLSTLDAVRFIKTVLKDKLCTLLSTAQREQRPNIHLVINLPGLALNFLAELVGLLRDCDVREEAVKNVLLHIYFFVKTRDNSLVKSEAALLLEYNMWRKLDSESCEIVEVSHVATNKNIMRATFCPPLI